MSGKMVPMTTEAQTLTAAGAPVLAVDVGGTKMAAGLVNWEGEILLQDRTPTPGRGTEGEMWSALIELCDAIIERGGDQKLGGVGVGCAGPMVWPDGVVSPLNITAWRGFPLKRKLQERYGGPVRIHNDAVAMAIAEHWKGAAKGYRNVVGMVVSTGVGGGLVLADRLVDGGLGNAGHIGHVVVDPRGPSCPCGGRGCLEAIARGPSTAAWAIEQGWTPRSAADPADARTLAQDARAGDPIAIAAYRRSGEAVGVALASVGALLDIDITVIGGGLVQSGPLLMSPLRQAFEQHAGLAHARRMKIVPAELDQDAGIVGAAALIIEGRKYWSQPD